MSSMNFETIREARQWASLFLEQHHREKQVADLLLMHHLKISRARLLADLRDPFPDGARDDFIRDIKAHALKGVPVQHLTGEEMFYGRPFKVNNQVLVPRQETEELVEGVLDEINGLKEPITVVDVGTGSGIIAITLKKERPDLTVYATDISEGALKIARENADRHRAEVHFLKGDFLIPLIEGNIKADVIVSNPPYIPLYEKDELQDVVRNYDPHLALFGGEDGLDAYRAIVKQAGYVQKDRTCLAFEIGHQQGKDVSDLIFRQFPGSSPEIKQDINGKERMVFCWI